MKHTFQAISAVPTTPRLVMDISGEPASFAANETLTSLLTAAGQIKFPSTQNPSADPNTLDDYEEGNWTPTITASVGTFTSVAAGYAQYTKVGRLITIAMRIDITTNGTAAGSVVSTLPFTVTAAPFSFVGRATAVGGLMLQGITAPSASTVAIIRYDNTYPGASGQQLVLTGSYWT